MFIKDSQDVNKKSKYAINSPQRKVLIGRIYPLLLVGSVVWLLGEILFSFLFSDLDLTGTNLIYYIIIVIIEVILLISFFVASKRNKILMSVLFLIILCFLAGILSLPIVIFTEYIPQVHMFVSLSVGANLIVYLITLFLGDKYFSKGYIWAHVIVYLIGCLIVEITFIVIFSIQNFLLTIPITLAYISIVSLVLMFWGVRTIKKVEKENWIYALFKILGILLVVLALAIVIVIIVLLMIIIAIICEGNLDLSGLGSGGTGGIGKKKKKQPKR